MAEITYNPLYSSKFLDLASLYIKKQNNMQAAVNNLAYFGKTAPILLRPRLLKRIVGKWSWKYRKSKDSEDGKFSVE